MADAAQTIDPEILEDLEYSEELRRQFAQNGTPMELWEAMSLLNVKRIAVREEGWRLTAAKMAGKAPGVDAGILQTLAAVREKIGPLISNLRRVLDTLPEPPPAGEELETAVGLLAISPKGRSVAQIWIQDPAGAAKNVTKTMGVLREVARNYRKALEAKRGPEAPAPEAPPPPPPRIEEPPPVVKPQQVEQLRPAKPDGAPPPVVKPEPEPAPPAPAPAAAAPAVELPPGVDPEILDQLRRVEECRKVFDVTHQTIEVWEVFCLVMLDAEETKKHLRELLEMRDRDELDKFNEGALNLFDQLLKMRAKFGKFVARLREFLATVPVGHFGKEIMEMALGFVVASGYGRELAEQWLSDPKRFMSQAAGRLESVIARTMKYQTALRMTR